MLTFNQYQEATNEYDVYSDAIRRYVDTLEIPNELKAANLRQLLGLLYTGLGMASEVGEFTGKLKKVLRDADGELDVENLAALRKENGDVTWYVAQAFKKLGTEFGDGAQQNLDNLAARKTKGTLHGSGDNR